MQVLVRRTATLARQSPILWAPYLGAQSLSILVWRLRGLAEAAILRSVATSRSVLGGNVETAASKLEILSRAARLYFPVGALAVFLVMVISTAAMVVTARLIASIESGIQPSFKGALLSLEKGWRRVLTFAILFLLAFGCVALGVSFLQVQGLTAIHRSASLHTTLLQAVGLFFEVGIVAWMLMPFALRLCRGDRSGVFGDEIRWRGAFLAIAAGEAGLLIGKIVSHLERTADIETQSAYQAIAALNSLVANAPNALLFMALALLALHAQNQSEIGGDAADVASDDAGSAAQI